MVHGNYTSQVPWGISPLNLGTWRVDGGFRIRVICTLDVVITTSEPPRNLGADAAHLFIIKARRLQDLRIKSQVLTPWGFRVNAQPTETPKP